MAFGLRNAAQALQRLKDNILMGLDYVFSFLDDDGVFSKSKEQHWTPTALLRMRGGSYVSLFVPTVNPPS